MALPAWAIAAIPSAISAIGGLISSKKQSKAANVQADIGRQQKNLYEAALPTYFDLINVLRGHAGLSPTSNPFTPGIAQQAQSVGGVLGRMGVKTPARTGNIPAFRSPAPTSPMVQPRSNEDRLRLQQAEENINQATQRRLNQLRMALGSRGLRGSSIDAAAQAALISDALRSRSQFEREQAIQAPYQLERRLGLLAQLLNPALGAGPIAAGIFGQQSALAGQQASAAGAGIGQSIQNYLMYDALRKARAGQTPGVISEAPFSDVGLPGLTPLNEALYTAGLGGYSAPEFDLGDLR